MLFSPAQCLAVCKAFFQLPTILYTMNCTPILQLEHLRGCVRESVKFAEKTIAKRAFGRLHSTVHELFIDLQII